jgi:hypothetical protein
LNFNFFLGIWRWIGSGSLKPGNSREIHAWRTHFSVKNLNRISSGKPLMSLRLIIPPRRRGPQNWIMMLPSLQPLSIPFLGLNPCFLKGFSPSVLETLPSCSSPTLSTSTEATSNSYLFFLYKILTGHSLKLRTPGNSRGAPENALFMFSQGLLDLSGSDQDCH